MRHYGLCNGIVVTNSTFTQAAVKLAGPPPMWYFVTGVGLRSRSVCIFLPKYPSSIGTDSTGSSKKMAVSNPRHGVHGGRATPQSTSS